MLISGSIGVTILKKDNKIILLLADDHSNKIYCNSVYNKLDNNDHVDIKNFLKGNLNEGNQILLEEVPRDNFELEELWPESPHTQELKELFLSETKITGIDIRPYLIPFSWEIADTDASMGNMTIRDYLQNLEDFFNLKGKFYNTIFHPTLKLLKIKNEGLGKNILLLKKKYLLLKKEINDFDNTIVFLLKNNKNILDKISVLCDEIMEFNTLLNAFTNEKKSIIHTGLFHSNNILKLLINLYGFKVIYKNGTNNFPPLFEKKDIPSCVYLPGIEKYGFNSPRV